MNHKRELLKLLWKLWNISIVMELTISEDLKRVCIKLEEALNE